MVILVVFGGIFVTLLGAAFLFKNLWGDAPVSTADPGLLAALVTGLVLVTASFVSYTVSCRIFPKRSGSHSLQQEGVGILTFYLCCIILYVVLFRGGV